MGGMPTRPWPRVEARAGPTDRLSAADARRVLLRLQALDGPRPRSGPAAVRRMVERLGYVQVDSINVLDRAHDRILATRLAGYRSEHLRDGLEGTRTLFEHWTHDASVIPAAWVKHWKHRFRRHRQAPRDDAWWNERFGGDPEKTLRAVLRRVRRDGPLRTRDLEAPQGHRGGGWWSWHPEKAAAEHLWRCGRLAIAARDGFEKVYDLFDRVVPEAAARASSSREHADWACREAIARLGIATATEIAAFFAAVPVGTVRAWAMQALRRGEVVSVAVESASGDRVTEAFATPEWRSLAGPIESEAIVPLSPFDPLVRDRRRLSRLFDFEYRFEAFVPQAKRLHGYYVLPLLLGDRLVGRIDPRFDRAAGVLVVRGPWWEPKPPANRRRLLETAIDRLAGEVGAGSWRLEPVSRS
jgi:uncharacterized protein YcaQ